MPSAASYFLPPHRQRSCRERGFTLVELAIVIVIIGLIAGGIVGGQALIRGSQMQSVIADAKAYTDAYNQFLEKYGYRPGDLPNATDFWGEADPDPGTCTTTIGTGTQTCNGNGDGKIYPDTNENFRAWQHLANAGFIKGQYTGVGTGAGNWEANPGINVPASRVADAGFSISYMFPVTDPTGCEFVGDYGHVLMFGAHGTNNKTKGMALTPSEALSIDKKIDDGLPARGAARGMRGGCQPNCSTSQDINTSVYNTAYKDIACMFYLTIED